MGTIRAILFDWGDTLMHDFPEYEGAMVFWPRVEVLEGAYEALETLHTRYLCYVASNAGDSDAELMGQALARAGMRQYFENLFTSKELGVRKPSPEFFSRILERIDVRGEECVMVGNEYEKDIVPAKSVGMKTVLLSRTEEGRCADITIPSMRHLVAAVHGIAEDAGE